jgi:FkbM family methyltransferase
MGNRVGRFGFRLFRRIFGMRRNVIHVNGRPFKLPDMGSFCVEGVPEKWLVGLMKEICVEKTGVMVDVGVNMGQTLLGFQSAGCKASYIGFEPNPLCVSYAEQMSRCNGWQDVRIYPVGLSRQYEVRSLMLNHDSDPCASMVEGFRGDTHCELRRDVVMVCGDEVLEKIGVSKISLIKIDVEGGELEVLRGLSRTLDEKRPIVVCEILPIYSESSASGKMRAQRQEEVLEMMRNHGYSMQRIMPDGGRERMGEIEIHSDLSLCNYLFSPEKD